MAITIPKVKSTVSTTTHVITFADGIVITLTGSNTIATRKAAYEKAYALANPVKPPVVEPPIIIVPPVTGGVREISYSDYCTIGDSEGQNFKVKPGSYTGTADHNNLKNCNFDLSGVMAYGGHQAIRIHGKSVNVSYNRLSLKDVDGYQIECIGADKNVYRPGVEGTFIDGLKIKGFTFDGGGRPFHSDGNVRSKNVHDGVIRGFEFSGNKVLNNLGSKFMVYMGNGFDFNIFGNRFTNMNKQNNEDNGMFYLKATGKLYSNIATDYQGYLARIWLHSIDGLKTVEAYNNIGYDGFKYGLIELQLPQVMIEQGAQPANARVFNNTAINLNKNNDWGAEVLTLYNTYGQVEYFNNLGAELTAYVGGRSTRDYNAINNTSMVFGQYDPALTKLFVSGQNIYNDTWQEIVTDLSTFKSKFNGIGAK